MNISVNFQFLNPFILVDYQQHIIIKLDLNREKVVIVLHGRQLWFILFLKICRVTSSLLMIEHVISLQRLHRRQDIVTKRHAWLPIMTQLLSFTLHKCLCLSNSFVYPIHPTPPISSLYSSILFFFFFETPLYSSIQYCVFLVWSGDLWTLMGTDEWWGQVIHKSKR